MSQESLLMIEDARLRKIIEEHRSIFDSSLRPTLPPKRALEHQADMDSARTVNISICPLS